MSSLLFRLRAAAFAFEASEADAGGDASERFERRCMQPGCRRQRAALGAAPRLARTSGWMSSGFSRSWGTGADGRLLLLGTFGFPHITCTCPHHLQKSPLDLLVPLDYGQT